MENNMQLSESLKGQMEIGQVFVESGMFPDLKTQAQAVVKIMAGRELGLTAFQSVSGIYMVNGRLALQANIMSALIKKNPNYDYHVDELTETECKITFYKKVNNADEPVGQSIFTFKDAAKAGLVNKDNWKSYPKNMLFARALSNGARWYCPDAICGYYSVEEMKDSEQEPQAIEPLKTIIEISQEGEVTSGNDNRESQSKEKA